MFCDAARRTLLPPGVQSVQFDSEWPGVLGSPEFTTVRPQAGATAMILYTSGSTGRPKGVPLDHASHSYSLSRTIRRLADAHHGRPTDLPALARLESVVRLARGLPFDLDLWHAQNVYHHVRQEWLVPMRARAETGEEPAGRWLQHFAALGDLLGFQPEPAA